MKLLRNIFFILIGLILGANVYAQELPQKGVGQWHSLPFADVRLLSCTTGSLDRNLLVGGLQIKIYSGWILKRPVLKPLSKYAVLDYPIRPDPVDTTQYTGTILLPIVYNVKAEKELHFGVSGNLVGCLDDRCLDIPINLEIPVDHTESMYTSYCAYIMDEMSQTPKLDLNVGTGSYIDDHTAVLRFNVPNVRQAFLQNQNGLHFKVSKTQFWQNAVQFSVSYPESWLPDTIQDWILITNQGVFRAPIQLIQQPLPPVDQPRPWGTFLLLGGLFFICSPFFILWGTVFPKTAKQLRRQCIHAAIVSILLTIGICLIRKYFPEFINEKMMPYILLIMGGTLIFPPKFVWWAGLLFIIWPKPYLTQVLNHFSLWCLIPWLIIWQIIPFFVLYRYAEFWGKKARGSLKKDFFFHNLFFLLPTILMLIYGVYSVQLDIPYQKTVKLYSNNPVLVCEKEDCVEWNELKINLDFIDAESFSGKTLLNMHQAKHNVLIFKDGGIWTFLIDTTPENFRRYLIGLKNYRAGYRPIDPPVHSGDDRHAPSPSAK